MNYRDQDRATKKYIYIVNIVIIFICILWWIGGYIFTLMINDKMNNISQLLQGGTMLLYSLYIPIAISIIESILSKKEKPSFNIELRVIFSEIFNVRSNICIIVITIISVILVDIDYIYLKLIGLILWVGANVFLVYSIDESGKYINSTNKTKYWLDIIKKEDKSFIDNINDIFNAIPNDKANIEKQSYQSDGEGFADWNFEEEKSFMELILGQVNKYIKTNEYQSIYKLLNIIYHNIAKINFKYQNKKFITKLFEYSYSFWYQYQESAENEDNASKSIELYEIYRISEEILIKILQKSLQDPHPVSATIDFFESLDRHIQGHKDKVVQLKGENKEYLEFFKYFGQRVITEILSSKDEFIAKDVLNYHWIKSDIKWQINLSNLQSEEDNKITYYWLNIMLEYIYETWKEKVFYNSYKKLEFKDIRKVNILINAFVPDINPILFIRVLELIWFKRVVKDNVKEYLKKQVFWGIISNVDNGSPEENREYENKIDKIEINNTIVLLKQIYKLDDNFYKDIQSQIKDIDLDTLDDEKKERLNRLQKTINYFKDIK